MYRCWRLEAKQYTLACRCVGPNTKSPEGGFTVGNVSMLTAFEDVSCRGRTGVAARLGNLPPLPFMLPDFARPCGGLRAPATTAAPPKWCCLNVLAPLPRG